MTNLVRNTLMSVAAAALLVTPAAHADRAQNVGGAKGGAKDLSIKPNGSVLIDGVNYQSMSAYQQSSAFRDNGRRCAAGEPPTIEMQRFDPSDCSLILTSVEPEYEPAAGEVYVIKTVFHVIETSAGAGKISDELILSQIEILNEDFEALTGTPGADGNAGKIRFELATIDPDGYPTTGINRVVNDSFYYDGEGAKRALNWPTASYFNIVTGDANGFLGYATFPGKTVNLSTGAVDRRDGVVLADYSVGRNAPNGGIYNQGRTATHEVGHYLGLYHTFQSGCGNSYTSGDLLVDTVPETGPEYKCVQQQSGCGGVTDNKPVENYMNYTNDTCMTEFTPEQVNRMRCTLAHYRTLLFNAIPDATFEASVDELAVQFTDKSSDSDGTIESYEWDFGDGNTSTEASPNHTFASFGFYDVTLTVVDDRGVSGVSTKTITVNIAPVALFEYSTEDDFSVAFVDKSTDGGSITTWAWDFGDGNTSSAQSPTNVYAATGTYSVSLTVTDDLDTTTTVTEAITIEEGGCGCASGGSASTLLGNFGLLGFALIVVGCRRRRRR